MLVWCRLVNAVALAVWIGLKLAGLEQEHSHLPHIEVDKVLGLMCDIRAKVPSYNAMPRGIVLLIKFLLDVCSYVLFNVEFFHGLHALKKKDR